MSEIFRFPYMDKSVTLHIKIIINSRRYPVLYLRISGLHYDLYVRTYVYS